MDEERLKKFKHFGENEYMNTLSSKILGTNSSYIVTDDIFDGKQAINPFNEKKRIINENNLEIHKNNLYVNRNLEIIKIENDVDQFNYIYCHNYIKQNKMKNTQYSHINIFFSSIDFIGFDDTYYKLDQNFELYICIKDSFKTNVPIVNNKSKTNIIDRINIKKRLLKERIKTYTNRTSK